jgi:tetratricopeptide (TPR) repeat protein
MESSSSSPRQSPTAIGAYRVHELLGTGGSAAVYRATDPAGQPVALKLLDPTASATPAERRRFFRSFQIASILSHPGIARLIEVGEHDGRLFVVEEFVDGETLADRLRRGRLPVVEALRILRKSADVLDYAHQAGVVHRDLSPRNLMLDRAGRVVLVDFGIAFRPDGTTESLTGSLVGTLPYLAPEIIRGRPASARSDLYALGAIAYEMLAGFPPFAATKPEAILDAHLHRRPVRLRSLRPEVESGIDAVLQKLLSKDPDRRYGNAQALLLALDEAQRPRRPRAPSRGLSAAPARSRRGGVVRRLAVAPFTADIEDGSDADRPTRVALGLAETVAATLGGLAGLTVVPPAQVGRAAGPTGTDLLATLGVDAVLQAHLVRGHESQRIAWSLVGRDGEILEGGRLGGSTGALFELEDALLAAILTALRRPEYEGRLRPIADRGDWYPTFLEALGCLQRTDSPSSGARAIVLLEQVRDHGAGGVQVHAALGQAYLRQAEVLHEPQWRHRAEVSCRMAIGLDPLAPEALVTMGRLLVMSGRAMEARDKLEHALTLSPRNVDALVWLSRALEATGDFDGAARAADRARRIRPDYWLAHDRLATLNFRRGRFLAAIHGWNRVIRLTPDNAHALTNLGSALLKRGALDQADEAYRSATAVAPLVRAFEGRGHVCFQRGQFEDAARWFREAIERAPGHWRYRGDLGDALRWVAGGRTESNEAFDQAIEILQRELRDNPGDAPGWAQLALYLARRDQHVEAHAALERALGIAPDSTIARTAAVFVHELSGHRDEAIAALLALGRGPGLPFELRSDPDLAELREVAAVRSRLAPSRTRAANPRPRKGDHGHEEEGTSADPGEVRTG